MHGLRSSRDGKSPGYPIIVLGGDHEDIPILPTSGTAVADWVCKDRQSCILDLSNFKKGEQRRFATDFAEQLFSKNRDPLHLIVDEADMFAPQRPLPDHKRMLGAFEDLVRRGRKKGIGVTLATQRPAVVHKDVLTQVALLVSLRLTGPQDRNALEDWIRYNADDQEKQKVLSSLATLPVGTAWFWSPGWLGMLKKAKVRQRRTFDSSATPVVGQKNRTPKRAPVDLEALKAKFSEAIERATQNDPAALRRRISELEKALAKKTPDQSEAVFKHQKLLKELSELVTAYGAPKPGYVAPAPRPPTSSTRRRDAQPILDFPFNLNPRDPIEPKTERSSSKGGMQRILIALAQNPKGLNKRKLGILAQLSSKSGSFSTYLSKLRTNAYIEGFPVLSITAAGLVALGDYTPLPTGNALQEYWINCLSGGASRMLKELCSVYPNSMTSAELGDIAEVKSTSGTFSTYLSKLRTLELVSGTRDALQASPDLFD